MNTFGSELRTSGCESGWTLYLEHSFLNQNASSHRGGTEGFCEEEQQHKDKRFKDEDSGEEDLSMLSDASSGPPLFPHYDSYFKEDLNGCFYSASEAVKLAKTSKKKQKVKENQHLEDQHLTFLHDTASSPVFDFSTVCSMFVFKAKNLCLHVISSFSILPKTVNPLNVFCHSWFLKNLQDNVTRGNQQTSVGSVVDYSQGFSATYFMVLDFALFF